ncbi:MAG TPA: hypothetical protein PKC91_14135 [Ignavibacteria bacterium]|nr:hypothetical protein [Ignavibacteria bacterium]
MKILKLLFLLLILFNFSNSFAQKDSHKKQFREKIDSVMKQKLIENADLDSISANKFIETYNESNKQIRKIIKEKKSQMEVIENDLSASDMESKIDRLIELETRILDSKKEFITDLKSFLTPQQIARTIILRKNLEKVMRKEINKREKK